VRYALDHLEPSRLAIFSRDELKQWEMRNALGLVDGVGGLPVGDESRIRWFIGDVRDRDRLVRALDGVDAVIHAAAMKQVDTAEYNPFECIRTNVLGAENVISACIDAGVERTVALSTDKASSPINLYGASKLCSDKLFVAGNHYAGHSKSRFAVVRYGNVMGSRGSVIPLFRHLASENRPLPITDERMTRFWITLPQAVQFVIDSFDRMQGGELYVPRIPTTRLVDLARAIAPDAAIKIVGIRPGEKLHEEMISQDEGRRTMLFDDHYVMPPVLALWRGAQPLDGKPMPEGFAYRSDTNDFWLEGDELQRVLASL
jgi:UDP-N-acetylglucosamine 4,6-dehydratase